MRLLMIVRAGKMFIFAIVWTLLQLILRQIYLIPEYVASIITWLLLRENNLLLR